MCLILARSFAAKGDREAFRALASVSQASPKVGQIANTMRTGEAYRAGWAADHPGLAEAGRQISETSSAAGRGLRTAYAGQAGETPPTSRADAIDQWKRSQSESTGHNLEAAIKSADPSALGPYAERFANGADVGKELYKLSDDPTWQRDYLPRLQSNH